MTDQNPLKLVTSPSNVLARMVGATTPGGTDTIEASLILREAASTAGVPVGTTQTQTLTNKTLTTPSIDEVRVSGSTALKFLAGGVNFVIARGQASTGAPQVGVDGTDANINLALVTKGSGILTVKYGGGAAIAVVDVSTTQTLTNKTLTTPTIGDFSLANHTHQAATSTGGQLDARYCFTPGAGAAAQYAAITASASAIAATTTNVQALTSTVPTILADALVVGSSYRVSLTGKYTTDGAGRTCRFIVSRDGTNHYFDTGAITLGNTVTDNHWRFEFILTCAVTGGSGSVRTCLQNGYVEGATLPAPAPVVAQSPQSLTVDTTVTNDIEILGKFGAASGAPNTVTLESFVVEKLN